jgi:hypothetical protein
MHPEHPATGRLCRPFTIAHPAAPVGTTMDSGSRCGKEV